MMLEIAAASLVAIVLPMTRDAHEISGLRAAVASALCAVLASSFHLLRRDASGATLMLAGIGFNTSAYFACAFQWQAYRQFDEPRASMRLPVGVATSFAVVIAILWMAGASLVPRTVVSSLFMATLAGAGAWQLGRKGSGRERSRVVGIGLGALMAACMLVRVVVGLFSPAEADFGTPSLGRTIAYFPVLLFTLGGGLGFALLHRERSAAQSRELALSDALTGCLNRRALEQRVRGELEYASRTSKPLALIVADVDHFKRVNDAHGHASGDLAIQHVASLLHREARQSDSVARYGGEEFCVLLRDASAETASLVAERIRGSLRATPLVIEGGTEVPLTMSFGVAAYDPETRDGWEELFKRADAALYRAKEGGRDRVTRG